MKLRYVRALGLMFLLLSGVPAALADKPPLDCSKKSLANAVATAQPGDTIAFTGVCNGPVIISTDRLALTGVGTAVIDGGGQDGLTVAGAHEIALTGFEVRNGLDGIIGVNGAHIALAGIHVHDNAVFGISLQTSSSAILSDVTSSHNGVHGLDLETGSAATVTKTFTSSQNGVFGINVNGSSVTFSKANVTVSQNTLGIQIATSANAFLNDAATVLNVNDNIATGLTVVSGAHMVSFGGTINVSGSALDGVSLNSKAGLDLDAGSQLNLSNNGDGLLMQEGSVMTVFNNPQFSGSPGFSTVNTHNNAGSGIRMRNGSTLTLSNQAKIISSQNSGFGVAADNGAGITLVNSTVTGNGTKDLQLTFGTRADLSTLTFGSYSCDATVLVRGTSGITCPH
jgi:hypothetical protein